MINEAAERLRVAVGREFSSQKMALLDTLIDAALAAERNRAYAEGMADGRLVEQANTRNARRATVREILERLEGQDSLREKVKLYARIRKVVLEVAR